MRKRDLKTRATRPPPPLPRAAQRPIAEIGRADNFDCRLYELVRANLKHLLQPLTAIALRAQNLAQPGTCIKLVKERVQKGDNDARLAALGPDRVHCVATERSDASKICRAFWKGSSEIGRALHWRGRPDTKGSPTLRDADCLPVCTPRVQRSQICPFRWMLPASRRWHTISTTCVPPLGVSHARVVAEGGWAGCGRGWVQLRGRQHSVVVPVHFGLSLSRSAKDPLKSQGKQHNADPQNPTDAETGRVARPQGQAKGLRCTKRDPGYEDRRLPATRPWTYPLPGTQTLGLGIANSGFWNLPQHPRCPEPRSMSCSGTQNHAGQRVPTDSPQDPGVLNGKSTSTSQKKWLIVCPPLSIFSQQGFVNISQLLSQQFNSGPSLVRPHTTVPPECPKGLSRPHIVGAATRLNVLYGTSSWAIEHPWLQVQYHKENPSEGHRLVRHSTRTQVVLVSHHSLLSVLCSPSLNVV